ncbi:MAG: class I SAM-dependent methyltransferase [Burkholderiales bacterium]
MSDEQQRLDKAAAWYLNQQLDFDRRMVRFRYESLRPHLRGPAGLELGSAEGEMTRLLMPHFDTLAVVDAADDLLERIPGSPGLRKIRSLFEDFTPNERFDTVVMEHVLEHVADPVGLLRRARGWLAAGGRILAGVPNAQSIHRLAAVKMGLLADPAELNARDLELGHRRVYAPLSLRRDVEAAGLRVLERGGVFFKPVSNRQIEEHWDESMIEGFHRLGMDFPEHAAEIFVVCEPDA